jgi:dipeptidyl aminopeptidase/acylaminoacyl peptidase
MKHYTICVFYYALLFVFFTTNPLSAQTNLDYSESYLTPDERISKQVDAPRHLNVMLNDLSPTGDYFLNRVRVGITSISKYSKPHYNIAGLQIDHLANRQRSMTIQNATNGIQLVDARTGERIDVETPSRVTITHPVWSPAGDKIAWFGHTTNETHIYVTHVGNRTSERVTDRPVLATLSNDIEWSADGRYLFSVVIPEDRGRKPARPRTPNKLNVRVTSEGENRVRTFPSLLEDAHEAALLEYYTKGQLVRIDTESGGNEPIGEPAMIQNLNAAPSGEHIIVQTLQKPFSLIVPVSRFAWTEEVWDLNGDALVILREREALEGVPDQDELEDFGRRSIQWRPDGEGLSLLMKPDKNDEETGEENGRNGASDRVMKWLPPFGDNDLEVVYESGREINSIAYSDDAEILFITERQRGKEHLFAVYTEDPETKYTIYEYDRDDFYENPGNLRRTSGTSGLSVVQLGSAGNHVFLNGTQYFEDPLEEAPRPFLDRVEIRSGEKERIFQSNEDMFEQISAVLDDDADHLVLSRQSAEVHPDNWLLNVETGNRTRLTENVNYNEAVTHAQRDRFEIRRADGFEFWMEVVMPKDWDGEPLPGLLWHYPREYDDQDSYDETVRTFNKNSFPTVAPRTADIMVEAGYAVLKPDWPIAGDRGTPNDGFIWSVVQNSTAVLDSASAKGYIDRHRMAIGGHSYGAFGSAHAMINTSFFKAGIAGAGNYNRTLTPFGFQRERADLWRGADRYIQMSPIFWADRLDGAFLMYHGEMDQNVGTWPINSERMFQALNSMNKTAVLYMYPYEGHGPAARETLLDMWARWVDWLDYHVK